MHGVRSWSKQPIAFIRPEQNNILLSPLFQISRARYYANGEHNKPFISFPMRIVTILFSSLLGHCNSYIELFCMTIIPIDLISNIQELHCLTSKRHIYNMYIFYIPELDFSSLVFSAMYFCNSSFNVPFLCGKTIQLQKWCLTH